MKKLLITVAVLAGIGFVLRRLLPDFGNVDWEKRLESMPDNAPPKWMFGNISAIRENTDRILELLGDRAAGTGGVDLTATEPAER